jgi:hypothetical protein
VLRSISNIQAYIDQSLALVERLIWPSQQQRDETSSFYVFKVYPKSLKTKEIKQWADLQVSSLSPFSQGDHYHYLSKKGLHLWVTASKFTGIPETAYQSALEDGEHMVVGKQGIYRQVWKDGSMYSCSAAFKDTASQQSLPISFNQPWAVTRNIDKKLKLPNVWLGLCLFALLCSLLWWATGYVTIGLQEKNAEQKASQLTESLGEKLDLQNTLRNNTQLLVGLNNWHQEYDFLPEAFALIAEKLNKQGKWRANSLIWQNKTMEIELLSKDIDITSLVSELEKIGSLQQVSIRPHDANDTWILEAKTQ